MTPNRVGGVLLGAAGVVLMIGPEVLRELGLQLLAQVAVLGAALSYALAGIFGRRFQDRRRSSARRASSAPPRS